MRTINLVILIAMLPCKGLAQAPSACLDLFISPIKKKVATVTEPKKLEEVKKPEPVIVNGKRLTADEAATLLEAGPMEYVERAELTEAELKQAVIETRSFLNDESITEKDVYQALFAAKNKYDAQIDFLITNAGQSLSITIRNMRKRRLMFADALQARETVKAANIYRNLWEAYYISKSRLAEYLKGDVATRDQSLVDNSKWLLLGMTEGYYKDLNSKVKKMYKDDRSPDISEVLSVYDQIFARSNDEFRYAIWYVNQRLADKNLSEAAKQDIEYVINDRLSIDRMAQKFGLRLLTQRYLNSREIDQLISSRRPQILIWTLKRMRDDQLVFGTALYIGAAVENVLLTLIRKIPLQWLSQGLESIVILNRNAYLLKSHLEKVEAVVNAPEAQRLSVFQSELGKLGIAKEEAARFLELFARMSEDMSVWNQLKLEITKLATRSDNYSNYKALLEMMKEAEKAIPTYGFISKFYSASIYDYSMALMLRGTPLAIAFYTNWPEVGKWFSEMFTYVSASLGAG